MSAAGGQHVRVDSLGIGKPGQRQQSSRLLGAVAVRHVLQHTCGSCLAQGGGLVLAQHAEQLGALGQRQPEHSLQAGVNGGRIGVVWPIQEASLRHMLRAVRAHTASQNRHKLPQVGVLLLQVVPVAKGAVPVAVDQKPPDRVGGNTVHPAADRRLIAHDIQ